MGWSDRVGQANTWRLRPQPCTATCSRVARYEMAIDVRSMRTKPDRCHSLRHLLTLSRAAPTMLPSSRWDTRTLSAGRLSASTYVLARSQANFAATHGRAGDITPSDHSAKKFRSVA